MAKRLISIIVPVYGTAQYLERCVKSIASQAHEHLEIILIDDGSTDESGLTCDALAMSDTRIKVVHKRNGGLSSARNTGTLLVSGEYIGFVDSDDYIDSDMYKVMLQDILRFDAPIACCGCRVINNGEVTYHNGSGALYLWGREDALVQLLHGHLVDPSACFKLYKKQVFSSIRFDEGIALSEDFPFNVRAFSACEKVVYRDFCPYVYEKRDGSLTRSEFGQSSVEVIGNYDHAMEGIANYSIRVKNAVQARAAGMRIMMYNASLRSKADYSWFRNQISSYFRQFYCEIMVNEFVSLRHRVGVTLIATMRPMYDWLCINLRRSR